MNRSEKLEMQINEKRKIYKTDSYPMSIGEFANLYNDNEVIINPDFQRNFRWTDLQKSKLIESILLGIPIPPIFVYQNNDGIWEVVDGLQRLSTILQFMNLHKTEEQLSLLGTHYLPELEGFKWESEIEDDENVLTTKQKLEFKRSKLNLSIILNDSDPDAKFDVFERLNTGGSFANPQEVRNSMMIMKNKELFLKFSELSNHDSFLETISLNDRLISEKYNMELALRFIALNYFEYNSRVHVSDFLDSVARELTESKDGSFEKIEEEFRRTFDLINDACGEYSFKKFSNDHFSGRFQESTFEFITIGSINNLEDLNSKKMEKRIKSTSDNEVYKTYSGSGSNIRTRVPKFLIEAPIHFRG